MKKSPSYKENLWHGKDSLTSKSSSESQTIHWIPELFGPVFETEKISLCQSYRAHQGKIRTQLISTFVPDEIIYKTDLAKKSLEEFLAVILFIEISNVIKLEADEILAVWKVPKFQLAAEIVEAVIKCGLKCQKGVKNISTILQVKIKITISTGNVAFSIIGNDNFKKWVLVGQPIIEAESAANNCNPGEVIITKSTWQYVLPSDYEYLSVDSDNVKKVSILSINLTPVKIKTQEIVNLSDKCFHALYKLTEKYLGIIKTVKVYPKRIFFSVYFGFSPDKHFLHENSFICAEKYRMILSNIEDIVKLSMGISTGMVFCGVIGHTIRQSFTCTGLSCEKSKKIATVANQYSLVSRKIDKIYPIIGCFDKLEKLTDILDDICVSSRNYCGVLIEGFDSAGKSRLLDECVLIAKSRQILIYTVSLNFLNITRAYNTIYYILLEMFQIHDCYSVEERKKSLIKKIGNIIPSSKFCYLNVLFNVDFTHSSTFLSENEEQHISKTLILFDKLLGSVEKPTGIFIDDIHFMDLESWAFVTRIMNYNNFFLAMTIDNSKSISSNHYNDSRLFKFTLNGFNPKEMGILICQLLNVHAISEKIDKILNNANWMNAGWCEAFISLVLERKWFEFYFRGGKVNFQDLISPPLVSVIKVPYGVFPEEINPHLPQDKFHVLDIKSTSINSQFIRDDTYLDIETLYKKLFHKLTSYEQSVLRSAAVLGDIFTREALENVTPNSMDFHTARAITRLMDLRILECASIQRFNYNLSPYVKRNTFSDMHHLLHCSCYQTNVAVRDEQLPSYAGCKLLEFKVKAFRRFVYDQILPNKKRELHSRAAEIYERQARTCISCGGGSFLNALGVVQGIGTDARALRPSIVRRSLSRDAIYFSKFKFRRRSSSTESPNQEGIHHQKISILPTHSKDQDESQYSSDELSTPSDKRNLNKSELLLLKKNDPSRRSQLKKFNLIDFRNCDCENVLNGVFQELLWHLQHTDWSNKLVEYMMEYSAGLIFICRYCEAFNILIITKEINDKLPLEKRWKNKYIIWGLMGDASVALGNISKAKKYFKEAIRLQTNDQHYDILCVRPKIICRAWHRKINRKLINRFYKNRFSENEMSRRLVIAYHLMKLSKVLLVIYIIKRIRKIFCLQDYRESNRAELIAIDAFNIGFSSSEGFTQKCELYIKACEIFRACKYKNALEIGSKLFKISKSLHVTAVQLEILPLLINLTIRMKRIYETADLMQELYHLSNQDIDKSSITWYYALSLDLTLDAGMVLESFEQCAEYAKEIIANKNRSCVLRDPESLKRLLTCLWIWQLRSGTTVTATFAQCCASYAVNIKPDNYAQLLNLLKTFEVYFLELRRCINIKRSDELSELVQNIKLILKTLEQHLNNAGFIKPRFYILKAYFKLAHGDKHSAKSLLKKARKYASFQGNEMLLAWILLNEKMWEKLQFNNTSSYWMENVRHVDSFNWRDIHDFDVKAWSSILFFISPPDSYVKV
ncbi:Similar to ADCY10: Adenylate cyclase type 10 (Homo sapiens) [Cotesia congregata]|uniref:Similar to ADCY10: Adenylate cyclase type 10 (Homo sapiens) n=1 Tax=Cotesia congregata TaxID=51543 RepID=A0A8J2HQJ9_COTCN|nr:Similar to ADCY10: Adenylate cyclase type 10 (Homo sapiens) [Cotesia congregata]